MPFSCGIFVYKGVTSALTKKALGDEGGGGWEGGGRFSIRLKKFFVPLMCDGRLLARDWVKLVMEAERWSFGPSHPETTGWRGQSGL